ncbi:MAG: hypothetical protein LH624_00025 [Cryobacterium sp.]|nr:hypothetical protein [Cryobacterium sp.]
MAGNYVDPPSRRMAYDRDGTIAVYVDNATGVATQQAQLVLTNLNDDDLNTVGFAFSLNPYSGFAGVIFPELRNIAGIFVSTRYTTAGALTWSANSTTLIDGTWTQALATTPTADYTYSPAYRTSVTSLALTGVRALRIAMSGGYNGGTPSFRAMLLFGVIPPAQSPDRLVFWHATSAIELLDAVMDFGDSPRTTTATKTFRIMNNSATMTATGVNLLLQPNPDATPTLIGQFQFSLDNATWTNTLAIGTLSPGQVSSTIYIRRNTGALAQLSLFSPRVIAGFSTFA